MKVPGVIYSLLLALAAWLVDWFTTGGGSGVPWAPIVLATVPIVLRLVTLEDEPSVVTRDISGEPVRQRSKTDQLLWG